MRAPAEQPEIEHVRQALRRTQRLLGAMREYWADHRLPCCPECAFGPQYSDLADKADRQAARLVVLLHHRGAPGDRQEASRLAVDYPAAGAVLRRLDGKGQKKEALLRARFVASA